MGIDASYQAIPAGPLLARAQDEGDFAEALTCFDGLATHGLSGPQLQNPLWIGSRRIGAPVDRAIRPASPNAPSSKPKSTDRGIDACGLPARLRVRSHSNGRPLPWQAYVQTMLSPASNTGAQIGVDASSCSGQFAVQNNPGRTCPGGTVGTAASGSSVRTWMQLPASKTATSELASDDDESPVAASPEFLCSPPDDEQPCRTAMLETSWVTVM